MPSKPEKSGRRHTPDHLFGRGTVVVLFAWGLIVLAFSVGGLADVTSLWWLILLFGLAAPVALFAVRDWASRNGAGGSASRTERELLAALREHGELTPTATAVLTSLTAAEAAKMLEELALEGHLEARIQDGATSYALREVDRRAVSSAQSKAQSEASSKASKEVAFQPQPAEILADPLTDRELAVLKLMAVGRTNKQIAGELFIAEGTVKAHVASIYRKLGGHSRAEAISRAADLNLL